MMMSSTYFILFSLSGSYYTIHHDDNETLLYNLEANSLLSML